MARDFLDEGEEARTDPRPTRPAPVRKPEPEERKLPVETPPLVEERPDPMAAASRRLRAAIDGRRSAVFGLEQAKKRLVGANEELVAAKAEFDAETAKMIEEAEGPMATGTTAAEVGETF